MVTLILNGAGRVIAVEVTRSNNVVYTTLV